MKRTHTDTGKACKLTEKPLQFSYSFRPTLEIVVPHLVQTYCKYNQPSYRAQMSLNFISNTTDHPTNSQGDTGTGSLKRRAAVFQATL